eukprot:COSAG06_NODE_875_length_11812_cov_5.166539_5_plen_92_part_00
MNASHSFLPTYLLVPITRQAQASPGRQAGKPRQASPGRQAQAGKPRQASPGRQAGRKEGELYHRASTAAAAASAAVQPFPSWHWTSASKVR